ncbi:hypothetical protein EID48_13875 [Bacillus velezensis]|nr:hypothetical protein EID48_13875 [Bacillus velezensis]
MQRISFSFLLLFLIQLVSIKLVYLSAGLLQRGRSCLKHSRIVDNGSSDGTREYISNLPDVKVI